MGDSINNYGLSAAVSDYIDLAARVAPTPVALSKPGGPQDGPGTVQAVLRDIAVPDARGFLQHDLSAALASLAPSAKEALHDLQGLEGYFFPPAPTPDVNALADSLVQSVQNATGATTRVGYSPPVLTDPVALQFQANGDTATANSIQHAIDSLTDPASKDLIALVASTPGLDPTEIKRYMDILGQPDLDVSQRARQSLMQLYQNGTPVDAAQLRQFFASDSFEPFLEDEYPVQKAAYPVPSVQATPSGYGVTFPGKPGQPEKLVNVSVKQLPSQDGRDVYQFAVNGHTINVTYPHGADTSGSGNTIGLASLARVFASEDPTVLTALSRRTISVVTPKPSNVKQYMDTSSSIVHIYDDPNNNSDDEFSIVAASLAHESGHAVQGDDFTDADTAAWKQAVLSDETAVSGYAQSSYATSLSKNTWEDFAESWSLFQSIKKADAANNTHVEQQFAMAFPARWAFLTAIYNRVSAQSPVIKTPDTSS